jgi:outer membrane protein assembly factor BamB
VQAGAAFVKLDKKSGETVWRVLTDDGGMNGSAFSSPVMADIGGLTQLVVQTRQRLVGVDPESGRELWAQPVEAFRGMNILTPVVIGDAVFTSTYGGKSWRFDISRAPGAEGVFQVTQSWENKAQGYMSTPVVIDGHAYLHLRNQRVTCLNLGTGSEAWTSTPFGQYWSMVAQGQQILALDERGDLLLLRANPEKFDLAGEVHVSDSPTWAHLAVSDSEIFVRDLEGLTVHVWQDQATAVQP